MQLQKNAQVFVDPDRVIEAVHMFFPRHSIAKVCTEDTQEHLLDLLLSVLQVTSANALNFIHFRL